jgi:hypothetical protein
VDADVFPAEVQWGAVLPGADPSDHTISAQWYYQDRERLGWSVLPNVSGVASASTTSKGESFQLQSYLATSSPARCLPDGQYRVELYADGDLVGVGAATAEFGDLSAVAARDLNVALCRPPDWKAAPQVRTGLATGYVAEDGSRGAFVFRYNRPQGLLTVSETRQAALFLESTISNFSSVFPDGEPTYSAVDGTDHDYFMGLGGPVKRYYDFDGGTVRVGAGVSDDGAIIVAFVFGPTEDFQTGGLGLRLFESLSLLEKVPSS